MSDGENWQAPGVRFLAWRGEHAGRSGGLVRNLGRGEWLVKLDNFMFGRTVRAVDMRREPFRQ